MKETNLQNICEGVANELFAREIKGVARNIDDVNTSALEKRKITLEFTFSPDEERRETRVTVTAKSSLAPIKSFSKTVWLGKNNGLPTMFGQDTRQIDMFDEGVTPLSDRILEAVRKGPANV